jgi:hypothetical protein
MLIIVGLMVYWQAKLVRLIEEEEMPRQSYSLEENGPKRLEVSWKGIWKKFTVTLDGNVIGTMEGQKELKKGREYPLPDESLLKVQLVQKLAAVELQVLRDGKPLPGSASDPEQRFKTAYQIIFFIAGLNLVLGLISELLEVEFLLSLGLGIGSVFFGLVFLGLGFWVRTGSLVGLILTIVIFGLDGVLGFYSAIDAGFEPGLGGIFARIILLIPMIQGVGAIRELEKKETLA